MMEKLAPNKTSLAPAGQSIEARGGVIESPSPDMHSLSTLRATARQPISVLICVADAGVRQLIGLLLANEGYGVTSMDVLSWIGGDPIPMPPPEVLILDAWPLRHADAAAQARARLASQPAAVVLLLDSLQPAQIADQLGAVATLPLLFTLEDLITAVQQGADAHSCFQDGGSHSIGVYQLDPCDPREQRRIAAAGI